MVAYERRAAATIQTASRAAMSAPRNDTHTGTTVPPTMISKPVARRTTWATATAAKMAPDV